MQDANGRFQIRNSFGALSALLIYAGGLAAGAMAQELLRIPDFPLSQVQAAADDGDAEALYILGTVYFKGKRVTRDYRRAATLFRRAAEQGLAIAQLHLAKMYFEGMRIPQNDARCFQWYRVAARQGLPDAQYGLGNVYYGGRGTAQDYAAAARWYRYAAQQGHHDAQYELGLLYATGTGVQQDLEEGYKWLALAAAGGVRDAVAGRDEVRNKMTSAQLATAQRHAAQFQPTPHYNADALQRQRNRIYERAKGLIEEQQ